MHRSAIEEQHGPQRNLLQIPEEELQESDSHTIMSDSIEPEESSMLLVSRELQQPKFDVIILDSDEGSDNIEQLDCSETQPDDDCVNDTSLNELISADEQPRTSSLDDQLSSKFSLWQLAVETLEALYNIKFISLTIKN